MAERALVEELRTKAFELRKCLIELGRKHMIHLGGDLSSADFMTVIWQYALEYDVDNPRWDGRDRFILSKGHAAAVTSFSQALRGCYDVKEIFDEYATDYGRFGMHSCNLINPYVDVSTGSLGHGLPVSAGIAQALRMQGSENRVYTVMGDGETDEGSIWEAAMLASTRELGNLIAFIDRNGLQLDAPTELEMKLEPYADKWRAFGWNVIEVDGHDIEALVDVVDNLPAPTSKVPTVVICKTVKGKKVSFMENQLGWHMGLLGESDYEKAMEEVTAAFGRGE